MKAAHMRHHFRDPAKEFGVICSFWDYPLGTKWYNKNDWLYVLLYITKMKKLFKVKNSSLRAGTTFLYNLYILLFIFIPIFIPILIDYINLKIEVIKVIILL